MSPGSPREHADTPEELFERIEQHAGWYGSEHRNAILADAAALLALAERGEQAPEPLAFWADATERAEIRAVRAEAEAARLREALKQIADHAFDVDCDANCAEKLVRQAEAALDATPPGRGVS